MFNSKIINKGNQKMKLKNLLSVNPDIDLKRMSLYNSYYVGGTEFDKNKPIVLIKRAIESNRNGLINGNQIFKERLKRASYINRCSGLVNWLIATATRETPKINVYNSNTPEYWSDLNTNIDGKGSPFSSLVRQIMVDLLTQSNAYIEAKLIGESQDLDFSVIKRDPQTILDYELNGDGMLNWVKTYTTQQVRSEPFGPVDKTKNIVTIYTPSSTEVYVFYGDAGGYEDVLGNPLKEEDDIDISIEESVFEHDFYAVPIFKTNATPTHWLLNRLADLLKNLFNAESNLEFALSQSAFPQPYLKLNGPDRSDVIIRGESTVLIFQDNEDGGYISPPSDAYESLFKNIERLKSALQETMNSFAQDTAALPQAGRLSGDAVREMHSPLEALINYLIYPVEDVLLDCLNKIAIARGEEVEIEIEGFGCNFEKIEDLEMPKIDEMANIIQEEV